MDEEKAVPDGESEDNVAEEQQAFLSQHEHTTEKPTLPHVNRRYWLSVSINTAAAVGLVEQHAIGLQAYADPLA